jgi:hypothetical protein
MLRNIALILLTLTLASCGGPAPAAREGPPVVPNLGDARYTCEGPDGFLPSVLDRPANAETEDHPSAAALRATLAEGGPDLEMLPESGYWLVSRSERVAEYVARSPISQDGELAFAMIGNEAGVWRVTAWGGCHPRIVLEGLSPATWILDPDPAPPAADTTTFKALVTETACNDGQPMGARLQPPSITYGPDSVLVVFAALARAGDGIVTCPGNPSTRVVVELREPLGDRRLLDAGLFPPGDPVEPEF